MKSKKRIREIAELRSEYDFDFSKAVRGKYYRRFLEEGSNVATLDPDIAKSFHDSASVNKALRSLLELTRSTERLTPPPGPSLEKTACPLASSFVACDWCDEREKENSY
jgi:hypothetical protein